MEDLVQLAGIAWDPHIRGVLVTLTGVVVLCGSVYLIVGTNLGARLGFLIAVGGFFGWMTILGVTWWLQPPAIGPRGSNPSWEVEDIVFGEPAASSVEEARDLPNVCWSNPSPDCEPPDDQPTVAAQLLAANPDLEEEFGEDATLTEIKGADPDALDQFDFGGWDVLDTGAAGEAQSAADEVLVEEGVFDTTGDYVLLDAFDIGGKEDLPDDPNWLDRIVNKIETTLQLTHPTHYAVVQLQAVVPQEAEPGEPPPTPVADTSSPVISVVMVRDLGTLRVPGALVTLASGTMLGVIAYALHRRDQLADEHRAEASTEGD